MIQTIPYHNYEKGLPQEGNVILGVKQNDSIFVYQAFNDQIADFAIQNQKFGGPNYSFNRMTWIKPNFLWMMCRSGWAEKDINQCRILLIEMTFKGFEELLFEGVSTSFNESYGDETVWRERLNESNVRIQWDPDHDFRGEKLNRRAVQIGIKGDALKRFNDQYIRSIEDITAFVKKQKQVIDNNSTEFDVINEHVVEVDEKLKKKFRIPNSFVSPFIANQIDQFEHNHVLADENFENFLIENSQEEREHLISYIKNYQHPEFSRYLLKTAIRYRKEAVGECMCEDLLTFSYFVSKNGTIEDFDLIMEAKLVDFDTWCGFDDEMIFYTLGYERTKDYLQKNVEKFSQKTVDHFLSYSEDYLYNDISSRAFWYL